MGFFCMEAICWTAAFSKNDGDAFGGSGWKSLVLFCRTLCKAVFSAMATQNSSYLRDVIRIRQREWVPNVLWDRINQSTF